MREPRRLTCEHGLYVLLKRRRENRDFPMGHAQYISSWLRVLKNDKRAIFHAAAYAQKATDYLIERQDHEADAKAETSEMELSF